MKLSLGRAVVLGSVAMACAAPAADDNCNFEGYDCSAPGQMCKAKCYETDARKDAFVKLSVSGRSIDSRDVPYAPKLSLDRALVYGCELWEFADKTHQSLAVQYKKQFRGVFLGGDPPDFEDDIKVYIPRFMGPGHYRADARYTASDEAEAAGRGYAESDACSMDVTSDGAGGVKGHFSCAAISSTSGASIAMSGEFACGGSALAPIISKLP